MDIYVHFEYLGFLQHLHVLITQRGHIQQTTRYLHQSVTITERTTTITQMTLHYNHI